MKKQTQLAPAQLVPGDSFEVRFFGINDPFLKVTCLADNQLAGFHSSIRSYISRQLPGAIETLLLQLYLEAVLLYSAEGGRKRTTAEDVKRAAHLQEHFIRARILPRGRGRPEETADEFLTKIESEICKLGPKPRQSAVAKLLNCDPSYLRLRRKKLGFKNWDDVNSHPHERPEERPTDY